MPEHIVVTAAVVRRHGAYLVTRRLRGRHLEGLWEFPGGKCEPGETHVACISREMQEELGCAVTVRRKLLETVHEYPERVVELHFFECALHGTPMPLLGQEIRWVEPAALRSLAFPPADEELIDLLSAAGPPAGSGPEP